MGPPYIGPGRPSLGMRFLTTLTCALGAAAYPLAAPQRVDLRAVDVRAELKEMVLERFEPHEVRDLGRLYNKRDGLESSIELLLRTVNRSGIIWDVLDLVAYLPSRIQAIANLTVGLLSHTNLTQDAQYLAPVTNALNYSAIFLAVQLLGIVTNLLDGILLDESYRPVLVNLVSRILEGNKNLFLYVVQVVFKKSKRDTLADGLDESFDVRDYLDNYIDDYVEARALGISARDLAKRESSLATFITNILLSVLSSSLVGNIAKDTLVALNNTNFLTYTVKRFIANEGYQNFTAQLIVDIARTGNSGSGLIVKGINITAIADKVLSKPSVLVGAVSSLLSGKINLLGLGKYADSIKLIVQGVENKGVFADLNDYVFSESHTVTTPLIPTNDIVVPRTTSTRAARTTDFVLPTGNASSSRSLLRSTLRSTQRGLGLNSANEVESILSELRATQSSAISSATSALDDIFGSSSSTTRTRARTTATVAATANVITGNGFTITDTGDGDSSQVEFSQAPSTTLAAGGGDIFSLLGAFAGLSSSAGGSQRRAVEVRQDSGAAPKSFAAAITIVVFAFALALL